MRTCNKVAAAALLATGILSGNLFAAPVYSGPVAAEEVRVRSGIGHVMGKIREQKPIKIAYFGGSITEMDGWRRLSREWLQGRYPNCAFTEVQAAIGGTGSSLGVYRLGLDVLAHNPDLVFVEFATNDAGETPENIWRNFDGIVRQIWKHNPEIDIIFTYTITSGMVESYGKGLCPQSASAMEMLADHYGIPSVCFGPRVAADVKTGKLVMTIGEVETAVPEETPDRDQVIIAELAKEGKVLFSKDGTHPVLPGHAYYLESIKAVWAAMEELEPVDHGAKLSAAFYDATMEAAKMVPIEPCMLSGTWRQVEANEPNGTFAGRFGGKPWLTETPGSKLKFRFRGSKCMIYDLLGPACGQLWISVDGVRRSSPVARFDSYCTYYRLANLSVFSGTEGSHEVEIELDKNQPSRQAVAFRLADPATELASDKYNGTEWFAGRIMLVGDIDMPVLINPADGTSEHVVAPSVSVNATSRDIVDADGAAIMLDSAVCFDAWSGEKPKYEDLRVYLDSVGDSIRKAYLDWKADFVLSFDRAVKKDTVSLYGQFDLLGEGWAKFPSPETVEADSCVRILPERSLTYGQVLDQIVKFRCGAKNLSADNAGMSMTVALRLYEPDGNDGETGRYVDIAVSTHCFQESERLAWFDAGIGYYQSWPQDAVLATGGQWDSDSARLSDVATLSAPGALEVLSQEGLSFAARDRKSTDDGLVTVIADVNLSESELTALPSVDPAWKGAVVVVGEAGAAHYYGLAKIGDTNGWVRLDGDVVPSANGIDHLEMTFREKDGATIVGYRINGKDILYGGSADIPVVVGTVISGVVCGGCGTVTSLMATVEDVELPIAPIADVTVKAKTAEEAVKKVKIVPAPEVAEAIGPEGCEEYEAMFVKVARPGDAPDMWIVSLALTEDGTNTLQRSADATVREIRGLDGGTDEVSVSPSQTVPGFYYGLAVSESLQDVRDVEPAEWKIATRSGIAGGLSAKKPSVERGFFVVRVDSK